MGTEPRMKSLLSVSLVLLSFSFASTSRLPSERNDGCAESSPFLIKNGSPNAKKPYLTLDVGKNSLSGGKLSKKGKPRSNQIWTWLNCADGDFLSNRAEGKLLSVNGKSLNVVDSVSTSTAAAWIYDSELGTLRDVQSKKYVRLIKRKARVSMVKKLKLMKKGPEKGKLGDGSVGLLSFWILAHLGQSQVLDQDLAQDQNQDLAQDQGLAQDQDLAQDQGLVWDLVQALALGRASPLVLVLCLNQDVLTVKQQMALPASFLSTLMGKSTTPAPWTTLLLEKLPGVQPRWTGWGTFCTLHQDQLGGTVSQIVQQTLTLVPLLPVPTLSLLSQRNAMPDTAALTRTFFSLATATQTEPEVVNQWTLLFKRSPRAPASLQPQIEVLLEVRHWSGTPPTAWIGSGTETGMWLSSKIKVRDQALVPGMCTTTSFLTSGHLCKQ